MKKDLNQRAFEVVGQLTGSLDKEQVISSHLSKIGKLGGAARAKKLTAKQRSKIAVKAAKARWNK